MSSLCDNGYNEGAGRGKRVKLSRFWGEGWLFALLSLCLVSLSTGSLCRSEVRSGGLARPFHRVESVCSTAGVVPFHEWNIGFPLGALVGYVLQGRKLLEWGCPPSSYLYYIVCASEEVVSSEKARVGA